ncbi:hypothetical protein [Pedobacter sp. GR22-6]|uniref:hypothetical protein n=1 Tax=Pedobacter sp. GR22-6 TaxID=3127957 RepID=UPI00307EBFDF
MKKLMMIMLVAGFSLTVAASPFQERQDTTKTRQDTTKKQSKQKSDKKKDKNKDSKRDTTRRDATTRPPMK